MLFVLFATLLALAEEAVAVTMTNTAPLFGAQVGSAYITASGSYLDVVLFHSVVVFIPLFIGWAVVLRCYDFSPLTVFWLFGLVGVLAEVSFAGFGAVFGAGMWIPVYGLMLALPAYCQPEAAVRGARRPEWYHYLLAIPLPLVMALPLLLVVVGVVIGVFDHPAGAHVGN